MSTNLVPAAGTDGFPAIFLGVSQKLTTSGSSQVITFSGFPSLVRVFCTKDCYIDIAAAPVANSSKAFLPGGFIEYFGVQPGQKIAIIQDSVAGTFYETEGL